MTTHNDLHVSGQFEKAVTDLAQQCRALALDLTLRNPLLKLPVSASSIRVLMFDQSDAEIVSRCLLPEGRSILLLGSDAIKRDLDEARRSRTNTSSKLKLVLNTRSELLAARLSKLRKQSEELFQKRGEPCGFAFSHVLRWKSVDGQDCQAPLVLFPIDIKDELDRDQLERLVVFSPTDREVLANPALAPYLRQQFSIDIPDLPTDIDITTDSLEAWYAQVNRVCERREGWSIVGAPGVGLFDCGAIPADCDPENWNGKLGSSHTLTTAFLSTSKQPPAATSNEFLPNALLLDADGSQLYALELARNGSNLVIHGPPGSGKSQTIINLIAQAMSDGKSVLFVAQKPEAALVVSNRLNKLKLGPFCTSLMPGSRSSHNNLKRVVLEGLTSRVAVTSRRSNVDPQKRARLERAVKCLEEYRAALCFVMPQFGRPARDIVAELAVVRARTTDRLEPKQLVEPNSPNGFASASAALQHLMALREELNVADLAIIGGIGPRQNSSSSNLMAAEFRDLTARLADQLSVLRSSLGQLRDIDVPIPFESLQDIATWATHVPDLSVAQNSEHARLALRLHQPGAREALARLAKAKDELRSITQLEPDARSASKYLEESNVKRWSDAISLVSATALENIKLVSLGRLGPLLMTAARDIHAVLLSDATSTSAELLRDAPDFSAWRSRVVLMSQLEHGREHGDVLCATVVSKSPNSTELGLLLTASRQFATARATASRRLDLNRIPDLQSLERQQAILTSPKGIIGRVLAGATSRVYRQAAREFKLMTRLPVSRREWADELSAAITYRRSHIELDELLAQTGCNGTQLAANALDHARSWMESIERSAKGAGINTDQLWRLMRERRDAALAATEKLTGDLCGRLVQETSLLQVLQVLSKQRAVSLTTLTAALEQTCETVVLANRQGQTWKLDGGTDLKSVLSLGHASARVLALENAIASDVDLRELTEETFAGIDTPIDRLQLVDAWYQSATRPDHATWRHVISRILDDRTTAESRLGILCACILQIAGASRVSCETCNRLNQKFEMRGAASALALDPGRTVEDLIASLKTLESYIPKLQTAFRHFASAASLRTIVGNGFIDRYLDGTIDGAKALESFVASTYESALAREDALAPIVNFDRKEAESCLEEIRALDVEIRRANSNVLFAKLADAKAPEGTSIGNVRDKTELALIKYVSTTPRTRISLKELYRRAGTAMRVMQPCTIATPTTVSEYLPREIASFDLVIIDEASQIEPASAIGSIARGKQLIVVGDPKQLPPTRFFFSGSSTPEGGDDEEDPDKADDVRDLESVLDRAIGSLTNVHLRGHYRSEHHSLIEWSNQNFYGSSLIVPPSTGPRTAKLGVTARHVENGFYSAGQNDAEARAVASAVLRQLRECPTQSVGVVAFNVQQARLIEECLTAFAKKTREDFEAFSRSCEGSEERLPLFVRSLESVQGDERDVIFVSYTYGPDPQTKKPYQRFGPVLRQGGERRLNVLVTRARKRVEVFHSLLPEHITSDSGGAPFMRSYLQYAMRAPQHDFSSGEYESDFERQVANVITQLDPTLIVKPQVGCAGFRIDLGVALESSPSRFLLGIECDGATYHSEPSARQRDMIRQSILEQHQWQIHRIWSTAWWHDFEVEKARLEKAILQAKSNSSPQKA